MTQCYNMNQSNANTVDDGLGAKEGQQSTAVLQQEDRTSTHEDSNILLAS